MLIYKLRIITLSQNMDMGSILPLYLQEAGHGLILLGVRGISMVEIFIKQRDECFTHHKIWCHWIPITEDKPSKLRQWTDLPWPFSYIAYFIIVFQHLRISVINLTENDQKKCMKPELKNPIYICMRKSWTQEGYAYKCNRPYWALKIQMCVYLLYLKFISSFCSPKKSI